MLMVDCEFLWIASGGGVKFVVQRWLASAGDGNGVNRFVMVLFFFFFLCERICGGYCTERMRERERERERERINKNKEMINKKSIYI